MVDSFNNKNNQILKQKDKEKYKDLLNESLKEFKGRGDDSPGPVIYQPWSLKRIRIFGSVWFSMLVFLLVGNILISGYLRLSKIQITPQEEGMRQLEKNFPNYIDESGPFEEFLELPVDITDRDYASFRSSLDSINDYFRSSGFGRESYLLEDGFHFSNEGVYYVDP